MSDLTGMNSIEGVDVPKGTMCGLLALIKISLNSSLNLTLRDFSAGLFFGEALLFGLAVVLMKKPD